MPTQSHGCELIERDDELGVLRAAVTAAARGEAALVLVRGPAGIGKSRLLAAGRATALAQGLSTVSAVGAELDRNNPFTVATQLFGSALTDPAAAAGLLTGQARLAAPLFDGSPLVPYDADSLVRGLYWLTVGLAGNGPQPAGLMLLVDDAQWADRASVRFLLYLATRLDGLPVTLVVGVRSGEAGAPTELLDQLSCLPGARVVHPSPLSEAGVGGMVSRAFPDVDEPFIRACAEVSGGNPFLLQELVLALSADAISPTAGSVQLVHRLVPASVARAVLGRLARLPDSARRLAEAAAVFGGPVPLALAASLAELPLDVAGQAADLLAAARILDDGEPLHFAHPLLAAAVHQDLPAFARARQHRRAADLLIQHGARAEEAAAHMVLATPAGDADAVRILRAAACSAVSRGDSRAAVELLDRALAEGAPPDVRFEVLLELAEAQAQAGDRAAAGTVMQAVGLAGEGESRRRALIVRARVCYADGDHLGLARATEQALEGLDVAQPLAQALLAGYLAAGMLHAPTHPRTEPYMLALLREARAGEAPRHPALLAVVALRLALDAHPAALVHDLCARAVAVDPLIDPAAHGMPISFVVQALRLIDDLDGAERAADAALASARDRGDVLAYALASYHRALPRFHRGALDDALADLEQVRLVHDQGWTGADGFLAELATQLHLARGDLPAARAAAELGAGAGADDLSYSVAQHALAMVALATDQPAKAAAAAREAGRALDIGFGIRHPGFVPWLCVLARATHRLGEFEEGQRFADEALERARWAGVPAPVAHALRTVARLAPAECALPLLEEAAALLTGSPARLERAAVLIDLGAVRRVACDTDGARGALLEGYALAEAMRAGTLTRRARSELHELGLRPRRATTTGLESLTPSERRIAELVASGSSNKQVAEALFVTPKTVETHLASVYRKLRLTSRRELGPLFTRTA